MLQEMLLVTLVTAICSKPTPEIRFLPKKFRWKFMLKERYGDSLRNRG